MNDRILSSLAQDTPPADLSAPLQALWWLKKGGLQTGEAWHRAHEICQTAEGNAPYDLVHALVHLIEADRHNATYWYRRSGTPQVSTDPEEEWRNICTRLSN